MIREITREVWERLSNAGINVVGLLTDSTAPPRGPGGHQGRKGVPFRGHLERQHRGRHPRRGCGLGIGDAGQGHRCPLRPLLHREAQGGEGAFHRWVFSPRGHTLRGGGVFGDGGELPVRKVVYRLRLEGLVVRQGDREVIRLVRGQSLAEDDDTVKVLSSMGLLWAFDRIEVPPPGKAKADAAEAPEEGTASQPAEVGYNEVARGGRGRRPRKGR